MNRRVALALIAVASIVFNVVPGAVPAQAVTDDCAAAATQPMKGTGNYTSDPALIARLVKNPEAPAYVFFKLKFLTATCAGAEYVVTVLDAADGTRLNKGEGRGPGTFFTDGVNAYYFIEFQIPIPEFQATDTLTPPNGTPSGVCVFDQVKIKDVVVHQGPTGGCFVPPGIVEPWPGLFLQLNPGGAGGGEFDM